MTETSKKGSSSDIIQFSKTNVLSISLIISALIISSSIFVVGGEISSSLAGFSAVQFEATGGTGSGSGEAKLDAGSGTVPTQPSAPAGTPSMEGLMDDDPTKGSDTAPVIIIEFSDFQCPYCGRFYSQTLSEIEKNYVDTGKVQMVFRDFPLSFHQQAKPAAMAAECANEQGKFWEMHDKLFENQTVLSEASMKQWAGELGLNTATFNSCFDSAKYSSEIDSDMADGSSAGITGTPGFLIGTRDGAPKIVSGAQPYSVFQAEIDALLS